MKYWRWEEEIDLLEGEEQDFGSGFSGMPASGFAIVFGSGYRHNCHWGTSFSKEKLMKLNGLII